MSTVTNTTYHQVQADGSHFHGIKKKTVRARRVFRTHLVWPPHFTRYGHWGQARVVNGPHHATNLYQSQNLGDCLRVHFASFHFPVSHSVYTKFLRMKLMLLDGKGKKNKPTNLLNVILCYFLSLLSFQSSLIYTSSLDLYNNSVRRGWREGSSYLACF